LASASLAELRAVTYKKRDSWWTVLLVDPLAIHLVRLADRFRWITPNRITLLAFLIGLASAGSFLAAGPWWLVVGAVLYHLAFVLDCVDGKLARWQKSGSIIGGWLDFTLDQVRLVICAVALLGGQYLAGAAHRGVFLLVAVVVVFLNMFRYFNGFLMERALFDLRDRLDPAGAGQRRAPSISDDDPTDQADEALSTPPTAATGEPALPGDDLGGDPTGGSPSFDPTVAASVPDRSAVGRLRAWLTARRIRLNVYSGIEFQMVVLILAPLAGAVAAAVGGGVGDALLGVTIAACVVMVAFELAQTGRFLRSARKLTKALAARPDGDVPVQRPANPAETGHTQR
jgi:phosphatidylglycerophosphate synthase